MDLQIENFKKIKYLKTSKMPVTKEAWSRKGMLNTLTRCLSVPAY